MVRILDAEAPRQLSLGEYVAFIRECVDVNDQDSLWESAWAIRALANDRQFLIDRFHHVLKAHWREGSRGTTILSPIAKDDGFYIRANIWPPNTASKASAPDERYSAYRIAHDHNFTFLTVGYFGPGYLTSLYQYDVASVCGCIGERVSLQQCGEERLKPGRVMMYEANKDVHIQHPPERLSVSLNLMCRDTATSSAPRYEFDVETARITRFVRTESHDRSALLELCAELHDAGTIDILRTFARRHNCVKARAQAISVLGRIDPLLSETEKAFASAEVLRLNDTDVGI